MSKSDPLVSVLVPAYNAEPFLAETIESVLKQDYPRVEIIVVNDGSTDGTGNVAQSFGDAIRYYHVENCGTAKARNHAFDLSTGELVAFLDSDDLWLPNKLSIQVRHLREHPEIGYCITRIKYFVHNNMPAPKGFREELLQGDHVGRILSTLLMHRNVFEKVGKFNPDLYPADDVDWFSRAADLGIPVAVLPQVLLHKRVHGTNVSHQTTINNVALLKLFRQSIERKRQADQQAAPAGELRA